MTTSPAPSSPLPLVRGLLGSLIAIPLAAWMLGTQCSWEERIEPASLRVLAYGSSTGGRELPVGWNEIGGATGGVRILPYSTLRVALPRAVEVFGIELRAPRSDAFRVYGSGKDAVERLLWVSLGEPGRQAPGVRRSPLLRVPTPVERLRVVAMDERDSVRFAGLRLVAPRFAVPHWALAPLPWLVFAGLWASARRGGVGARALSLWQRLDLPIAALAIYAVLFRLAPPGLPGLAAAAAIAVGVFSLRRAPGPVLATAATIAALAFLAPRVLAVVATSSVAPQHELTIDHRLKPNGDDINDDGIRFRGDADELRDEDFVVLFLGDSFTFGLHLEDHEAYPQVFEQLHRDAPGPRVRAVNFGWASSCPLLSLRLLRELGSRYKPDLLVYNLDMTDFHDDLKNERLLRSAGELEVDSSRLLRRLLATHLPGLDVDYARALGLRRLLRPPPPREIGDLWFPDDRFFATALPLSATREWLEAGVVKNLAAMHAYASDTLGIPMALVIVPRAYQFDARESPRNWEGSSYQTLGPHVLEPFRYFEEKSGELPYPVISLLETFTTAEAFPLYLEDDPHWNAAGARLAAESVARSLRELGLLPGGGDRAAGPARAGRRRLPGPRGSG